MPLHPRQSECAGPPENRLARHADHASFADAAMSSPTPRLRLCAATWTLLAYPSRARRWSLRRQLAAMREAGFEGVYSDVTPELHAAAAGLGLELLGGFDAPDLRGVVPRLERYRDLGVTWVNIQLLRHDTTPEAAARAAVRLTRTGERLGLRVHFETHRDTATETPEKFSRMAALFRRTTGRPLPVTWDHSHFAAIKHLQPAAFSSRLLAWPREIQSSQLFHLRPFNGQHLQVPVTDARGRLTPECRDYLRFVADLFGCWLAGPRPGGEIWACPELGMSHGYHLSTERHPWPQAIRTATELSAVWAKSLRASRGS